MLSGTGGTGGGGPTGGGLTATPFTMCSDDVWSAPSAITSPQLVIAQGLCELDKVYLHYGKQLERCANMEASRISICNCQVGLTGGNNVLILPWAGMWQLEFKGEANSRATVFIMPFQGSWDTALSEFMKSARECCDCNGDYPLSKGECGDGPELVC